MWSVHFFPKHGRVERVDASIRPQIQPRLLLQQAHSGEHVELPCRASTPLPPLPTSLLPPSLHSPHFSLSIHIYHCPIPARGGGRLVVRMPGQPLQPPLLLQPAQQEILMDNAHIRPAADHPPAEKADGILVERDCCAC